MEWSFKTDAQWIFTFKYIWWLMEVKWEFAKFKLNQKKKTNWERVLKVLKIVANTPSAVYVIKCG